MAAPMESMIEKLLNNSFQKYAVQRSGDLQLQSFVKVIETNKLLLKRDDEGSNDIVGYIHQCLNNSKQRYEGLILLGVLVKQSSTAIFQKNAVTWLKLLLNILQSHCPPPVHQACCKLLSQVIDHSDSFSDVSREVTSTFIPQLLPLLLTCEPGCLSAALTCVSMCIRKYPGPVGPFKAKLQTLVEQKLANGKNYEELYECFALLASCGSGGNLGIKHTEAWSELAEGVLASLHETLSCMYSDVDMGSGSSCTGKPLAGLPPIDFSHNDRVVALFKRWCSLTKCMQALLREDFNAVARVPADDILNIIFHCLSVNTNMLMSRPTSERSLLASFSQDVHIHALYLLQQLITLCGRNLIPQGVMIVSVLTQELSWSHSEGDGHDQHYGCLREVVFETLTVWIKALDACSSVKSGETTLVKEIIHDCLPYTYTLKMTSGLSTGSKTDKMTSGQGSRKGHKGKGYHEISQGISTQRKSQPLANHSLVKAALEALYWMLTTSGWEFSQKSLQSVQEFVIRSLLALHQAPLGSLPAPYADPSCRRGLYRVLSACVTSTHANVPPPVQVALGLFSAGLRDKHADVSSYCMEAMRLCEVLIHHRVPCLKGPVVCENLIQISGQNDQEPIVSHVINKSGNQAHISLETKNGYSDASSEFTRNEEAIAGRTAGNITYNGGFSEREIRKEKGKE
ncbi:hypothetical protein DPMN_138631 [Dreissena polymorpha]|uniref:Pre-rRNA-processing protein RIX1 N-terminal domain-containing protein n=1 Tax=Dreissena polymorpha TaxID=45954 RepID=A0A9D4G4M3_DREPO|nr:hypothetical protein DPMN_138631 [Dreissena polymorpha]